MKLFLSLGSMIVVVACQGCAGASVIDLRSRAARKLDCAPAQLSITRLEGKTHQVKGCGREATYLQTCPGGAAQCQWQLDDESVKTAHAPAASSSSPSTRACVPGSTQACLGPGACKGAQACNETGTGFLACDCGKNCSDVPSNPASASAE